MAIVLHGSNNKASSTVTPLGLSKHNYHFTLLIFMILVLVLVCVSLTAPGPVLFLQLAPASMCAQCFWVFVRIYMWEWANVSHEKLIYSMYMSETDRWWKSKNYQCKKKTRQNVEVPKAFWYIWTVEKGSNKQISSKEPESKHRNKLSVNWTNRLEQSRKWPEGEVTAGEQCWHGILLGCLGYSICV